MELERVKMFRWKRTAEETLKIYREVMEVLPRRELKAESGGSVLNSFTAHFLQVFRCIYVLYCVRPCLNFNNFSSMSIHDSL